MALKNPYEASRNIYGRFGRVFRTSSDGKNTQWLATVTELTYTCEIEKMDVKRAGTRWDGHKAGGLSGSGSITLDKVNSLFEVEFINYVNGLNLDGTPRTNGNRLPEFLLQINQEDPDIAGIIIDAATGNAASGHESIVLKNVKFWQLPGGYSVDAMRTLDIEFTFEGISIDHAIVDPPA